MSSLEVIDSFRRHYRFLSNFYPSPLVYEGIGYPTVEHAYQASKTTDVEWRRRIANVETAGQAKGVGRTLHLREDWEEIKLDVMHTLLQRKFIGQLRVKLLATGDKQLVEGNTWGDTFWGVCRGEGENHLGRLLMEVRSQIQADVLGLK